MKLYAFLIFFCCAGLVNASHTEWGKYQASMLKYQEKLPGWCDQEKAKKMMDLTYETQPLAFVEVGVFGGSSLYPVLATMRYLDYGVAYAIDPWSNAACTQGYSEEEVNYGWWNHINLEKFYQDFLTMLKHNGFLRYCHVMRMTSREAAGYFHDRTIDILHIDGNHSEESALEDVEMFLPKVKPGGYIWFDDADWVSTNRAIQHLLAHCDLHLDRSTKTCFLFQKRE